MICYDDHLYLTSIFQCIKKGNLSWKLTEQLKPISNSFIALFYLDSFRKRTNIFIITYRNPLTARHGCKIVTFKNEDCIFQWRETVPLYRTLEGLEEHRDRFIWNSSTMFCDDRWGPIFLKAINVLFIVSLKFNLICK